MDKDNMGSKEFFNLMGERKKHITIIKLINVDGTTINIPKEMEERCCSFKIYTTPPQTKW
jgi:hypothetical protein